MEIARATGAEIVSVDSMQIYRGMDIGTAKPSTADRSAVRHHMIDVADPSEAYSVARFQEEGRRALDEARERGSPVLVVGGSGLHFRSLVDPLVFAPSDHSVRSRLEGIPPAEAVSALLAIDPEAAGLVDLANRRRVARALEIHELTGETPTARAAAPEAVAVRTYQAQRAVAAVGIDPGSLLASRIAARFAGMMAGGLLDEVRGLAGRLGETARAAVGYRQMVRVVAGEWDEAYAVRRAVEATKALARRQRTFHRRDPRITWLQWDDDPAVLAERVSQALEEAGWTS